MTQPDQYFPDSAFNYDSLSDLAARSQEDWEAEIYGKEEDRFGGILGALFDGLEDVGSFTLSLLASIGKAVLKIPGAIWHTAQDALEALGDFIGDIGDKAQGIIDKLVQFFTGNPNDVNNTIFDLIGVLLNPANWLRPIWDALGWFKTDSDANNANLKEQLDELRKSLTDDDPDTGGGHWDCSDPDVFVMVTGELKEYRGRVTADHNDVAVAHVPDVLGTNRHKIALLLTTRRDGITRAHICSNDAATNYLAVQWDTSGSKDRTSLVLGGGPNSVTTLLDSHGEPVEVEGKIPSDSLWVLMYDGTIAEGGTNTYYVFCNGVEKRDLRWTDTGNLVTHGPGNMRAGFTCDATEDWWDLLNYKTGYWVDDVTVLDYESSVPA